MAERKPICGFQGESSDDLFDSFLVLLGLVETLATGIGLIGDAVALDVLPILGFTGVKVGLIGLSAVAAAVGTFLVVSAFYYNTCVRDPDRVEACSAGVINEIERSFNSVTDELFPFTAMHDRVDVVVKCNYWHLVENNAEFIKCAKDDDESPVLQGFYKNNAVCAAGLGSVIGAAAGAIGGIIAGAALGALIGCATIVLCILAIIVAALVAAIVVLVGAFAGGQIGKASIPSSSPLETAPVALLELGDYVTTNGGLITSGDSQGARVYWFVTKTFSHGDHSPAVVAPPFSHKDPDENLTSDACAGAIIL